MTNPTPVRVSRWIKPLILLSVLLIGASANAAKPSANKNIPLCALFAENLESALANDQVDKNLDGLVDPYCGTTVGGPLFDTNGRFIFNTPEGRLLWVDLGPNSPFPPGYYQAWFNTTRAACADAPGPDLRQLSIGASVPVGLVISIWIPNSDGRTLTEYFAVFGDFPESCDTAKYHCSNAVTATVSKTGENEWTLTAPADPVCLLTQLSTSRKDAGELKEVAQISCPFQITFWGSSAD